MNFSPLPLSTPLQLRMKAVMILYGYRCRYCGGEATEVDQIIPKSKGGTDDAKNLVACCQPCNASKSDNSLPPDVLHKVLVDAWVIAGAVDELIDHMRLGEMNARQRRQSIHPWKVA